MRSMAQLPWTPACGWWYASENTLLEPSELSSIKGKAERMRPFPAARLKLWKGQQELTPEQEAEARRFALERIKTHLATEPVDEQEAEAWLRQAYQVAGLAPPTRIHWLDGPLQLVDTLATANGWGSAEASVEANVWGSAEASVEANGWGSAEASVKTSVKTSVQASVKS